ncbi:hypothetical protein P8625_09520 [Tenacibaculum tangerinum]|uniref:Uncharacterized protein n=1 Tax=Tenacibaculum tangerinum TaxID=3038772 RepID=A0ABY8KYN4_9FLAO|nr:hypothetical protein [Tenacibaculum tangerinum]WGH74351.1 hypothetical protein P8625_09520 [Tenacibaculum tangerinum]
MKNKKITYILVFILIVLSLLLLYLYSFATGVKLDVEKNEIFQGSRTTAIVKKAQNCFDSGLLNGVCAENEEDNALFEIKDDTLRYVEYYDTPYLVFIKKNKLTIRYLDNKILSESLVLKLSKDSLVLKTNEEKPLRLINRKE